MLNRTRHDLVQFRHPFQLRDEPHPCAAGAWMVRTEEELLEGLSFLRLAPHRDDDPPA